MSRSSPRSPTVVITGASAGIGRAITRRFARTGARIGLIARDQGALEDVKSEVEARGGIAAVAAVDVADAAAVTAATYELAAALGPIDIWINNAMVTVFSPLTDMTPQEFKRVTDVTYMGCVHGTQAALQHMRERDRGRLDRGGCGGGQWPWRRFAGARMGRRPPPRPVYSLPCFRRGPGVGGAPRHPVGAGVPVGLHPTASRP